MIRTLVKSNPPLRRLALASLVALVALVAGVMSVALAQDSASPSTSQTPDVPTLLRDGGFYLDRGDCALAQYFFQEALKTEPQNADALVGKGRSLACQQAYPQAIEAFQQALEADANNVPAFVHLALAYQDQYQADPKSYPNRLGDALDIVKKAESIAPNDPKVLNTKGIVQYQLGNLQDARTTLERAGSLASAQDSGLTDAERSTVQVNLGRVYRDLGEMELAQQAFRRAVVLDPTNDSAHNNLGNVAYRLNDCGTAEYELSQAVSLNPKSLSATSQLGITLFECGEIEASVPRLEDALKLDGAVFVPPLYTYLARAYLKTGKVDDAVKRAQQGALLPPESTDAYYWLGQAYQTRGATGDVDNARTSYQRALEIDPNNADAKQALDSLP